jgi:cytoskeletal protein RodZ
MTDTGILGVISWRERKGISLESISASTKLCTRYLDAIETGAFELLPGGIYNTSFLKQYAQAIGFDQSELLDYYKASSDMNAFSPAAASRLD